MTIVITPRLKKSYEKAKAAEHVPRPIPLHHPHFPHFDEDIADSVARMRDTFDPCHFDDKVAAHPLRHQLEWDGDRFLPVNSTRHEIFDEWLAVFLMQGKRPLGSSKLGRTEAETKSYLPSRPGVFYNSMFPLEGAIRVDRPENGYRTILTDVDLHVLFANCDIALDLLTRLPSQPWCPITEKESRFFRALIGADTPAVDFARSLRFVLTDAQSSVAVFYDVARQAPSTDTMPSFLSVAALAQYPVVDDESKHRENIRILDAFDDYRGTTSSVPPI